MQPEEIAALFDQQAASYDQQWSQMAPINNCLHLLTGAVLSELSPRAHLLCIGSGTGAEILYLAQKFPGWCFTAVEPSLAMLEVFERKAKEQGILERCVLHGGFVDFLPAGETYDAATAFLVSQFILEPEKRVAFFQNIAQRLRPGGLLVSSDLAGNLEAEDCENLLEVWFRLMRAKGVPRDGIEKMRQAYARDVAILPLHEVRDLLLRAGLESPVVFFQAGMIHAWSSKRSET